MANKPPPDPTRMDSPSALSPPHAHEPARREMENAESTMQTILVLQLLGPRVSTVEELTEKEATRLVKNANIIARVMIALGAVLDAGAVAGTRN